MIFDYRRNGVEAVHMRGGGGDIMKGTLKFRYDEKGDVLYSFINRPRRAYSVETPNGVALRVDPKTKKIVGFTIVDYRLKLSRGLLGEIPHFGRVELPRLFT